MHEPEAPERLTAAELVARYAAGERDFEFVNLAGEDLSGQQLAGIRAYGSDLSNANCERANLEGADLGEILAVGACFRDANMRRATVNCREPATVFFASPTPEEAAELSGADCTDAHLSGHLPWASFRNATLERAAFEGIHAPHVNFDAARMREASFLHVEMPDATFRNADLSGASWASANLDRAVLSQAQADGLMMHAVRLRNARCRGLGFGREVVDGAPHSYQVRGHPSEVLAWPQQRSWLVGYGSETRPLKDAATHWRERQQAGDPAAEEMTRLLDYLQAHPPRRGIRRGSRVSPSR